MTVWGAAHFCKSATHLFGERGALEQVAGLAAGWFTGHLAATPSRATA
jgi:hypothetical protein